MSRSQLAVFKKTLLRIASSEVVHLQQVKVLGGSVALFVVSKDMLLLIALRDSHMCSVRG